MRIIAGTHRGRTLEAPPGKVTRPMLDRVREAAFSILESRSDGWDGASVLDLFAGTGSLGLEALSRGAGAACFVERDRRVARVLRANVTALGLDEVARVVVADALSRESWCDSADIAFLDPPYPLLDARRTRERVLDTARTLLEDVVAPGGTVVFHAPRRALRASEFGPALEAEDRDYGTSTLWLLRRGDAR